MNFSILLATVMSVFKDSTWVSESDWKCLGSITKIYFTTESRVILLDQENPQFYNILLQDTPFYIYNDFESWRYDLFNELSNKVDFVIIRYSQNDTMFSFLTRAKTIAITRVNEGIDAHDHDYHEMKSVYMFVNETDNESDIYSWVPLGDCWTDRQKKLKYLDTCKDGELKLGVDLYPIKTSERLHGCPLSVDKQMTSTSLLDYYTNGPVHKLVNTLVEKMNATSRKAVYDTPYVPADAFDFPQKAQAFQRCLTGCNVIPTFFQGELVVAVPTPNPDLFSSLYSGLSTLTWCLIFTGFVTMTIFVVIVDLISDRSEVQSYTVADVLRTIVGNSAIGRPKYFVSFQVLVIVFEFYSLHIIWFYQITSLENLFFGSFEKPIESLQEAKERNLVMLYNDIITDIKIEDGESPYLWNDYDVSSDYLVLDDNHALKSFIENKTGMLFNIKEDISFHFRKLYPTEPLTTKFNLLNPPITTELYTLCICASHPLHEPFSRYITYSFEAGLFNFWMNSQIDIDKYAEVIEKMPLTTAHMQPVFAVVLISLSFAVLVLFIEICVKCIERVF